MRGLGQARLGGQGQRAGERLVDGLESLSAHLSAAQSGSSAQELAYFYRDHVLEGMKALREVVDELETRIPAEDWPYPSYGEILYSVR